MLRQNSYVKNLLYYTENTILKYIAILLQNIRQTQKWAEAKRTIHLGENFHKNHDSKI